MAGQVASDVQRCSDAQLDAAATMSTLATMRHLFAALALLLPACGARTEVDSGGATGAQAFPERCVQISATPPSWIASHDFGTTDPATLARVIVFAAGAETGFGGPNGGAVDGETERPYFEGGVAFVSCPGDDAGIVRYFILEP